MASDLAIDYCLDFVAVKSVGDDEHRLYYLLVSGLPGKEEAKSLVATLKQDGFRGVKILK